MTYDFYAYPPLYSRYLQKLRELKASFPFLQLYPIGKSLLGRGIYALSTGKASPCVLFVGATHAQEWLTCSLLLRFMEDFCQRIRQNTPEGRQLRERLAQRGLVLIPMLNPDGVSIALEGPDSAKTQKDQVKQIMASSPALWQANARGVDLNHNFNAGFAALKEIERAHGITRPAPRQFGGDFPHSEPETQAVVEFLRERNVECLYTFHSQGEEIYAGYGSHTPPQSRYLLQLLCEASGYAPVANDGLCSHGGMKDYFIERYHRPGFTIEIGKGENPLPIADLEPAYTRLREMMALAALL